MSSVITHQPNPKQIRTRIKQFFFPKIEKRWSAWTFANIASAVFIAWVLTFEVVGSRWHLGVDPQEVQCLPYDFFLVSQSAPETVVRGKVYQFKSKGMAPVVKDGTSMAKYAAAVAGDKVDVNGTGIYINGNKWGDLNPATMAKTKTTVNDVTRSYVVPEGKVLMLGSLPRSYDGRYTGLADASQITGRAFPLW